MKSYELRKAIPKVIQKELESYPELVQKLLYYRGIETRDDAQQFLNPSFETHVHDPFLLPNMEAAVERICAAIAANERVTIYSDYDADGVPGAVVLHDFFKKIGFENFSVYIPHRNREGFGLNHDAITAIVEEGTTLLITIDCGVTDVEQVKRARSLGMDVVITDHHEAHGALPDAIIVNHKLPDSVYPERILCGAGVIFKVVQGLLARGNFDVPEGFEKWWLDMVGLATLSDMVPLVGENRAFAHYGLLVLRKTPRKGLLQLFRKTGTQQQYISETDVGFTITPRINAASRMGEPLAAFHMLATQDEQEAQAHVEHLHHINDMRKGHVAAITKAMHQRLATRDMNEVPVIAAGDPRWQPSLLGLVANALSEHYQRPTFLWGRGDGKELKGSCRTANGISVVQLMQSAHDVLHEFGGHHEAGGFVVAADQVDFLEPALFEAYHEVSKKKNVEPTWIDAALAVEDISSQLFTSLRTLAPFGVGNPEPLFLFKNTLVKVVEQFGKTGDHLRIICHNTNGEAVEAIAFFTKADSFTRNVAAGDRRDIVATLEESVWGRRRTIRLRLIDVL